MATSLQMSPQVEQILGEIRDNFRFLANGFQRLDKIKDSNRQSKQLEELKDKMVECKRLIKEFDREIKDEEGKNPPEVMVSAENLSILDAHVLEGVQYLQLQSIMNVAIFFFSHLCK
ncbi:novel plant SNARE 13-like isoform X2 [Arachis duranensis]|uniref:Novel plant SNARE 13-like isoform X2 n=1 Tax=Arachis duranensis TaxID=130453 RepID=A0A9C6TED2_ARADU|nr:novel plant SNARE 13-like isoform X2 [Arachis duranensis]